MRQVLLVAGPPASATLWRSVAARLADHGLAPRPIELFDPAPADPTVAALAATLADEVREAGEGAVLVAHGTAVPIAWEAARLSHPSALVLSNGPVTGVDPFIRTLTLLPRALLAGVVLRPGVLQRWLASSAGLRRTVVNPYVMDRDTVVALCGPLLQSARHRRSVAGFLTDLAALPLPPGHYGGRTLLCWGDGDPLYPAAGADAARTWLENADHITIPGGHHFHPEERPWALADAIVEWLSNS